MSKLKQENSQPNIGIRVSAPARLHLGFLDLNGSSGRKFGSIGLAIDTHQTVVEARHASAITVRDNSGFPTINRRVESIIETFYATLGQHLHKDEQGVELSLLQRIPEHAGLGSGTQLALAIGTALCKLHNISTNTRDIASQLGRGARSGIGIATFDRGGFVIDGGLNNASLLPPQLAHYDYPKDWSIIIIMDETNHGIHGEQELTAFKNLPTFPLIDSQAICHLALMKLLPALVELDIEQFGHAITEIQALLGDHFAPAQGGRYTSPRVASLLNYAKTLGHTGVAQSSWGPTGCIFLDNVHSARQLMNVLDLYAQKELKDQAGLSFKIAHGQSDGAKIETFTL